MGSKDKKVVCWRCGRSTKPDRCTHCDADLRDPPENPSIDVGWRENVSNEELRKMLENTN